MRTNKHQRPRAATGGFFGPPGHVVGQPPLLQLCPPVWLLRAFPKLWHYLCSICVRSFYSRSGFQSVILHCLSSPPAGRCPGLPLMRLQHNQTSEPFLMSALAWWTTKGSRKLACEDEKRLSEISWGLRDEVDFLPFWPWVATFKMVTCEIIFLKTDPCWGYSSNNVYSARTAASMQVF